MLQSIIKPSHRFQVVALGFAVVASTGMSIALAADTATPDSAPGNPSANAHAWGGKHSGMHKGCGVMKQLGLNEDQKSRFKAAGKAFREENKAAFESMKAKHQQLQQLGDDPANEAQRQQLRAELKQEREALHAKRKASMQGILTPEQESKWQALKKECMAKHKGRRGQSKAPSQPAG